jgi:hypothetical protein
MHQTGHGDDEESTNRRSQKDPARDHEPIARMSSVHLVEIRLTNGKCLLARGVVHAPSCEHDQRPVSPSLKCLALPSTLPTTS